MLGSIKYNLKHLLDFSGRDARQTFWYYVLIVYVVNMVISFVAIIPGMISGMSAIFAAAEQGAEAADLAAQNMVSQVMPMTLWSGMITGVLMLVLLAASTVRRLHDSDLSGWWAALPGAIYAYSIAMMPSQMEEMQSVVLNANPTAGGAGADNFGMMQGQMQAGSWLGILPILFVIVIGVRKSSTGPNRFGEGPVRF